MCKVDYYGTIGNQGYHVEDTYPKTDMKVGKAELEEIHRADMIDAACYVRQHRERRNFKGYE